MSPIDLSRMLLEHPFLQKFPYAQGITSSIKVPMPQGITSSTRSYHAPRHHFLQKNHCSDVESLGPNSSLPSSCLSYAASRHRYIILGDRYVASVYIFSSTRHELVRGDSSNIIGSPSNLFLFVCFVCCSPAQSFDFK